MTQGGLGGVVSYWLGGVDGIPLQAQNVNQQHYAASLMKLPVAIAAYRLADRGLLDLDEVVPVHSDFASQVDGERFTMDENDDQDPETWAASEAPLRDLVRRSLTHSGNLASNLVLERTGLAEVATVLAEAHSSPMTQIERGIEDAPAREAGLQNLVTAHDMARVLAALANRTIASSTSCIELEQVLQEQRYRDAIPAALPDDVAVGNKTGWIDGIRHDVALIRVGDRPVIMCILTTGLDDEDSEVRISELARFLWDSM